MLSLKFLETNQITHNHSGFQSAVNMLRSGVSSLLRKPHHTQRWLVLGPASRPAVSFTVFKHPTIRCYPLRSLSSGKETPKSENSAKENTKEGDDDTKEIVLTPGEQVVVVSRLIMWGGILAFASVCAYFIGRELIPTYVLWMKPVGFVLCFFMISILFCTAEK